MRPVFHRLPPPTDADIAALLVRVQRRVERLAGNGVFQVRNRGVTLQVDLASVLSNRLLNP